ncbi:MAG: hypothetical protein H6835_02370 [Planctomycetes bacterium]|nr:hypothetical protein [Planctomycetota bacterium]
MTADLPTDASLLLPADADWLQWLDRPPLDATTALAGHVALVLVWRSASPHGTAALVEVAAVAAELAAEPVAALTLHVPFDDAERDPARLRRALAAAPLPLPSATVTKRSALRRLGVGALPTLLLVDATGRVVSRAVGVPRRARLREAVVALLDAARAAGRAALSSFAAHASPAAPRLLPSAIAAVGDELWVASVAGRRVLRCTADGRVTGVVGGAWGAQDGGAEQATFAAPSACCVHDGFLVVADAGTHTLRAIDRQRLEVTTWCGTGRVSGDAVGGAYGRDQGLSSPSGVASRDGGLYLSQAGTDQVWQVDPMTGAALAWFGAGAGEHVGPPLREPRGLAFVGDTLWLCEAGSGELTAIDLAHLRSDPGLIGLSRPVAVVAHGEQLLVAAAAQPAVLQFDPRGFVQKVLFDASHGLVEPVGLACTGDRLFVADAGADRLWTADLAAARPQLEALELVGLPPPIAAPGLAQLAAPLVLRADSDVTVAVPVAGLAEGAEVAVHVVDEAAPTLAAPRHAVATVVEGEVAVVVPAASPAAGAWRLCVEGGERRRFVVPVRLSVDGAMMARLRPAT